MSTEIKFRGDNRWWTVRAEDERFSVLTRQAAFQPKGVVFYTIVDKAKGHRGPCNLIGQGWDFNPDTLDADAEKLLRALNHHREIDAWLDNASSGAECPLDEVSVEISHSNRVHVDITATREATS